MDNTSRILVTGATGFIGANLVHHLLAEEYTRLAILLHKGARPWRIAGVLDQLTVIEADLSDAERLDRELQALECEYIFHLAAYGAYVGRPGQDNFQALWNTNVEGTMNLFRATARLPLRNFINVGSSSEYGRRDVPMREDMLGDPHNSYGLTKLVATSSLRCLAKQHEAPLVTVRPFAIYGPFEDPTRLVPTVIQACLDGRPPELASPDAVRDFLFVDDLIDLLKRAASYEGRGEIFNAGSGKQATIREAVETILAIHGSGLPVLWGSCQPKQPEPTRWEADMTKTRDRLHWHPRTSLEEGLRLSYQWYAQNDRLRPDAQLVTH